jgi:acyl carrier protein
MRESQMVAPPMTSSQLRLWYMAQLEPGNVFYNVTIACRLDGDWNVEALKLALQDLVERHAILRTRYPIANGKPTQVVDPSDLWTVRSTTTASCESDLSETIATIANSISRREINLETGPLFSADVVSLSKDCHLMVLLTHHISIDQQSINVMLTELDAFYSWRCGHLKPNLEPAISYHEYADWQAARLIRRDTELRNYWNSQLVEPPKPLPLPCLGMAATRDRRLGHERTFVIDKITTDRLRALCSEKRLTPFMVLFAIYTILMHLYTQRTKFFVGTTTAFRGSRKFKRSVGCFINPIALQAKVSSVDTFQNVLDRVQATVLDAFEHYELPFERFVRMARERYPDGVEDFVNIYFQLQPPTLASATAVTGRFRPNVHIHNGRAKFPLMLNASDLRTHIDCVFEFDTDYFGEDVIDRLSEEFVSVLDFCLAGTATTISELVTLRRGREWVNTETLSSRSSDTVVEADVERRLGGNQARLAQIWFELLGVRPRSPSDSFVELGGHSLLAAQLAWRIKVDLGVNVRLADLRRATTLNDMARLIEVSDRSNRPTVRQPAVTLSRFANTQCELDLGVRTLGDLETLLARAGDEAPGDRMVRLARTFWGAPFQFDSRRPLPQKGHLPVRLGTFDCFTFVLTVLALTRSHSVDGFCRVLGTLRYRGFGREEVNNDPETGTIFDFAEEALLLNAVKLGYLKDVTELVADGSPLEIFECRLFPVRRQPEVDPLELWATPKLGQGAIPIRYIPRSSFECLGSGAHLRNGDVLLMSRGSTGGGGFVDHLGIVDVSGQQRHLLQATRHCVLHSEPRTAEEPNIYTGIFYDAERRREQIGVGVAGRYMGDEYTIEAYGLPLFTYAAGDKRPLTDYLGGAFSGVVVLRADGDSLQ